MFQSIFFSIGILLPFFVMKSTLLWYMLTFSILVLIILNWYYSQFWYLYCKMIYIDQNLVFTFNWYQNLQDIFNWYNLVSFGIKCTMFRFQIGIKNFVYFNWYQNFVKFTNGISKFVLLT